MNVWLPRVALAAGMLAGVSGASAGQADRQKQQGRPLILQSIAGRDSFEFYCASCHGMSGRGDGPVVPALTTRPADLTTLTMRNGGAFPRDRVLGFVTGTGRSLPAHGTSDMPVWGPTFRGLDTSDARVKIRIDNIVNYIETLQAPAR